MGKYRSAPKNELDDQRALLDELMGMDRDLQEGERGHAPAHFSDCLLYTSPSPRDS